MNNTFLRAILGFTVLTAAIAGISGVALWAIAAFGGGGSNWASLLVIVIALVVVLGLYSSMLHDPIKRWVNGK